MFKFLCSVYVLGVLMACSSGNDDMEDILLAPVVEMTEEDIEVEKGNFVSDGHPTTGTVSVNDDKTILSLKNFKTDNGPKLNLYLSTEVTSNDYVDLGDLKGIEGDFDYDIPENTDLEKYKYVVVWCVDFSVSFGHAELE